MANAWVTLQECGRDNSMLSPARGCSGMHLHLPPLFGSAKLALSLIPLYPLYIFSTCPSKIFLVCSFLCISMVSTLVQVHTIYYELSRILPPHSHSYIEALTPIGLCWEIGPLRRLLRLNKVIKVGPWSHRTGVLMKRWRDTDVLFLSVSAQGNNCERTQRGDSHLQARKRGLRRNQPCQHLDFVLKAPRTIKK